MLGHGSFYDVHQRLVECYEADILMMQEEVSRLSNMLPLPTSSKTMPVAGNKQIPSRSPSSTEPILQPNCPPTTGRSGSLPPMQPKSGTGASIFSPPVPEDEVQILDLNHAGLWQSEAFQEDLQACMIQKREMEALFSQMSGTERSQSRTPDTAKDKVQISSSEEGLATANVREKLFRPRAFWADTPNNEGENEEDRLRHRISGVRRPSIHTHATWSFTKDTTPDLSKSCFSRCLHNVQHPGSWFRAWWDTFGMMLLTYDILVIPLKVFEIPPSPFLDVMFWVAHIYWNLNIPVGFVTGYDQEGILVMDLRKTSKNYGFSWFPFDLGLVSLDWFLLFSDNDASAGMARLSRTARSLRFLRLFRLGRVVKVGSVIQSFQEQLTSRVANLQYSIFKLMLQLLLCNHIIACLWFLIGDQEDAGTGEANTWVAATRIKEKSMPYQYWTSLHWAYAQLGVGQTEIEAVNLEERIFSVCISVLALLNFSTMVSSMTSLLASLQKLKNEEIEQFSMLRRYLNYNHIDPDLSHRVTRFLQHTFDLKNRAISKDVDIPILAMLSKPLQEELQFQRHRECFREHEFLRNLLNCMDDQIHRAVCDLCSNCLKHTVLALDDVVFTASSVATSCYFIADGNCHYDSQAIPNCKQLCNIWVAEICLWVPWVHLGHMLSQDISRLISMEVTKFAECMGKDATIRQMAFQHATEVVAQLDVQQTFSDLPLKQGRSASGMGADAHPSAAQSSCWPCRRGRPFAQVVPNSG